MNDTAPSEASPARASEASIGASTASPSAVSSSADWSVAGLRLAVELRKDLLLAQAQRRQALEQGANQLVPVFGSLLIALSVAVYGGHLTPFGDKYVWLWAMAIALIAGMAMALAVSARPFWGYAGMEPQTVLSKYASEGSEHGVLKTVFDEYARRVAMNKRELDRMLI